MIFDKKNSHSVNKIYILRKNHDYVYRIEFIWLVYGILFLCVVLDYQKIKPHFNYFDYFV